MDSFQEINVSPFTTNVLDLVDVLGLVTRDGRSVEILRAGLDFRIRVGGIDEIRTADNISASSYLNALPVGRHA